MSDRLTPLPWAELVHVFERDGFMIVREEGDHLILTKQGVIRPLVIPRYRRGTRFYYP